MTVLSIIIAAVFFFADFVTKRYVLSNVSVGETFGSFTPLIDFTYVQNTGAAFSIMSGKMGVLSIVSVAFCISVVVYWILKRPTQRLLCISLAMIFGGALGNAVDRIFYGFVVDFIETTFIDFPVFNIADIGITVGVALLMIHFIFFDKEESNG